MNHKLIITADDFGMCQSVNQAIEECAAAHVVLSTNVMTNMEFADEAADLKRKFNYLSAGLHYNFSVGKPLTRAEKVPSLVDENGFFLSYASIRKKCRTHTYYHDEIKLEMEAQYRRFVDICGEPDYWNTHENVHVYPGLYQLFRDMSLSFGIKAMRTHKRIYVPASSGKSDHKIKWTITNPIKQLILSLWHTSSEQLGIGAPDGLLVRINEKDKLNIPYLFSHIQWKNNTVAEIAIHPSTEKDNVYCGDVTDLRVAEYECFSSNEILRIAKQNNIDSVGFVDCNPSVL